ncbi:MAG: extracellular solute-binding protein [Oscillospiraceae bacterium]|jgi:ABC-type glycerol-3-phosphate transport system substrate-binding protein|nr:extracellular solute-binding protein [Oscillospiraceae bacterium]
MKKLFQILALLCAVALILGLTGCSGKKENTSETGSSELQSAEEGKAPEGTDESEIELTAPGSETSVESLGGAGSATASQNTVSTSNPVGGGYTLTTEQEKKFASLRGTTMTYMQQTSVLSDYDKKMNQLMLDKYGVTMKPVVMSWAEMRTKIASLVASKTAPDFVSFSDVVMMRYVSTNIAQAIDSYLVKDDGVWSRGGHSDFMTVNSKTYGVGEYRDQTYYVYYNQTLFDELRIKTPYDYYAEGNWNFENFRKAAREATVKKGNVVETYGVVTWNPTVFLMANGASGIVNSGGKWSVSLGDTASMNALQLVRDIAADGSFSNAIDGYTGFLKRQNAMLIERPQNAIGAYDYYNVMKDKIGMAPMPKGPDVSGYYAPSTIDGYFVPLGSVNPLAAVAFMYEKRRVEIEEEVSTDPEMVAKKNRVMSEEHRKIRDGYMTKATQITTDLDGLSDWWDGASNRPKFWNKLIVDHSQPAQAVDSMKSMVLDCLKKTVGGTNVK